MEAFIEKEIITGLWICLLTALLSGILGNRFIAYMNNKKIAQPIREDGPLSHKKKCGTPTMGGIFFISAFCVTCLSFLNIQNAEVYIPVVGTLLFGLIGWIDDFKKVALKESSGLSSKQKILLQLLFSIILIILIYQKYGNRLWLLYLPGNVEGISMPFWFAIPLWILFIVFFVNSVNLTDGLDGLAAGNSLIILFSLLIAIMLSYSRVDWINQGQLIPVISAFSGALIGFLWFNIKPAKIFMGDTGSQAIGGFLVSIAILMHLELIIMIMGSIFIIEAISVIIQVFIFKVQNGKRVFLMAPLHHHYEKKGVREVTIVQRFWIITTMSCIFALSLSIF